MSSASLDYDEFCRAVARRLFTSKSQADYDLEIKRLNKWADGLDDKEEKKISNAEIKKLEKKQAKAGAKPWFATGKVRDEDDRSAFPLTSVWKAYKETLSDSPRLPMRGPLEWDLTKWTAEEKRKFEFGAGSEGSGSGY